VRSRIRTSLRAPSDISANKTMPPMPDVSGSGAPSAVLPAPAAASRACEAPVLWRRSVTWWAGFYQWRGGASVPSYLASIRYANESESECAVRGRGPAGYSHDRDHLQLGAPPFVPITAIRGLLHQRFTAQKRCKVNAGFPDGQERVPNVVPVRCSLVGVRAR